MTRRGTRAPLLTAALLAAAPAAAQPPASPALGEIVVTGEKQETSVQAAPLSITALSGDALRERNVNQLVDLDGYVPGLTISKSEGAERIITIRGIGYETAQNPNSQPGVAFHIDGVYVANVIALNQDLLDVDRIEVLRGPQGTVFGETSTGGAINVVTRKPVIGEASGSAEASGGTHGYLKLNATANVPVTDTIAARASLQYLRHGPYGVATAVPGYKEYPLEDANNVGVRGSVLWQPSDRFSALLAGQGFFADHDAALQKDISDPDPRPRHVTQDYPGRFNLHTEMAYLTLTQALGDWGTLRSVSAWQYLNKHQSSDNDRLASPTYFDNVVFWQDRSRTWTQEVTLSSVPGGRLDWVAGGFFLRQRAKQNILELTVPSAAAAFLPDGEAVKFQSDSPYQHTTAAGYGQATWHATDRLSLIAGARYSWDRITAQPYQYFTVVPPRAATSDAVTAKAGVEWKLAPASMAYLTASRGYKPTGLNFNTAPILVPTTFRKETVDALEIGSKNDFFDHRLRVNVAGYYYWYRNFQFTAEDPEPFQSGTDNIPRAQIYGAEVEATALPFAGLRLDGTLSLARGHFTSHFLAIDAQTAAQIRNTTFAALGYPASYFYDPRIVAAVSAGEQDVDGNRVPKLPGVQARGTASYGWHMAGGRVTIRGEAVYRGAFNYRLFAIAALDRVPAYTVGNAYLEYAPDAARWKASVSALNITNTLGINSKFSDPYGSGTTSVEYIDPREIFGTLSVRF